MRKTKLEKGITLVALIITIVVLLILAVVSIGAIRDSKIIGHSKDASDAWKQAQENEIGYLEEYEEKIAEIIGEKILWVYDRKCGYMFIGNVEELLLTINDEIKYGKDAQYNDETGEITYNAVDTIKIDGIEEGELYFSNSGSVNKLIIGDDEVCKKISIDEDCDINEIVILDGCTQLPDRGLNLKYINVITIPGTVVTVNSREFEDAEKAVTIYFGETKATWESFSIDSLVSGTQIICSDGTITIE